MKKPKMTLSPELDVLIEAIMQSAICGFYLAISVVVTAVAVMSVKDHTSLLLQIPSFFVGLCLYQTFKNFWIVHRMLKKDKS